VLLTLNGDVMVLLHGFIKKERKTPRAELALAKRPRGFRHRLLLPPNADLGEFVRPEPMSLTAIALLCSTAAAIWCLEGLDAGGEGLASFIASRALSIVVVNVSTRLSKSATSPISSATKASR
jgi:hypothetical protein